jgi:hypothetical protein
VLVVSATLSDTGITARDMTAPPADTTSEEPKHVAAAPRIVVHTRHVAPAASPAPPRPARPSATPASPSPAPESAARVARPAAGSTEALIAQQLKSSIP